jgi:acetyl-CoA acyltransferase 1
LVVGTVLGDNNQRANEMRIAQLMAGIPASVPMHTLNRQCSSGLQAIAECAANIKAGFYDVALACGVEHMSSHEMKWKGSSINPNIFLNEQAKDILMPMGVTSENVASDFKISRHEQDELAVRSHALADAAIKSNRFSNEIVPIMGRIQDEKTREMRSVLVSQDEGVRLTSLEGLAKLKPAFDKSGSTTAGNASQVSDGAAVSLVCSRKFAREHKLPVLGIFKSFAVAGCPPRVMGIGPVFAIPAALKKANLTIADIDLFEINEAFASQACYVIKHLGIPLEKVNVNGGAIALGHPLGCTGVRMTATLLHEMHKRKARYGVVSMCIG